MNWFKPKPEYAIKQLKEEIMFHTLRTIEHENYIRALEQKIKYLQSLENNEAIEVTVEP